MNLVDFGANRIWEKKSEQRKVTKWLNTILDNNIAQNCQKLSKMIVVVPQWGVSQSKLHYTFGHPVVTVAV